MAATLAGCVFPMACPEASPRTACSGAMMRAATVMAFNDQLKNSVCFFLSTNHAETAPTAKIVVCTHATHMCEKL
jgi:hypothetical protein